MNASDAYHRGASPSMLPEADLPLPRLRIPATRQLRRLLYLSLRRLFAWTQPLHISQFNSANDMPSRLFGIFSIPVCLTKR